MAPQRGIRKMGLALALVAMVCHLWAGARGQSSCTSALTSLASCLNYIGGNSSTPSSSCCSSLASVVQSNPQCLCSALNSGAASGLGISINQTRALQLPSACNVQTPPASRCSGSGASPSAPTASPSASPAADDSPDGADSPSALDVPEGSGSGSKTVPSTDAGSSGGNTAKAAPLSLLLLLLFVATFGSSTAAKI